LACVQFWTPYDATAVTIESWNPPEQTAYGRCLLHIVHIVQQLALFSHHSVLSLAKSMQLCVLVSQVSQLQSLLHDTLLLLTDFGAEQKHMLVIMLLVVLAHIQSLCLVLTANVLKGAVDVDERTGATNRVHVIFDLFTHYVCLAADAAADWKPRTLEQLVLREVVGSHGAGAIGTALHPEWTCVQVHDDLTAFDGP